MTSWDAVKNINLIRNTLRQNAMSLQTNCLWVHVVIWTEQMFILAKLGNFPHSYLWRPFWRWPFHTQLDHFKLLWKDIFICGIFQSAAIKQCSSQYFEAPVSPLCLKCEAGIKITMSTLPTEIAAFSCMHQSCCCLHHICPDTYDICRGWQWAFLTLGNNSPPQDQYQQNQ